MDDTNLWIFPQNIGFKDTASYMERLETLKEDCAITFDLRQTVTIHSSFIGFLIHAKIQANIKHCRLSMLLSMTVERILIMLNVIDFFSPEIICISNKKSA